MREIKFKAWNGSKMLNRSLFDRNWYDENDKLYCEALPRDKNILQIMQYTGVKDKNGKEIYEGDVIKRTIEYAGETTTFIEEVIFDDGCFVSRISDEIIELKQFLGHTFEVIGNIHENHELLKK